MGDRESGWSAASSMGTMDSLRPAAPVLPRAGYAHAPPSGGGSGGGGAPAFVACRPPVACLEGGGCAEGCVRMGRGALVGVDFVLVIRASFT